MNKLDEARQKINKIDAEMAKLFENRMIAVEDVFRNEDTCIVYVTSDGTAKGKFIGVVTK